MDPMSTSTTTTTPAAPANDGVLRPLNLSRLDPADTLTFDSAYVVVGCGKWASSTGT